MPGNDLILKVISKTKFIYKNYERRITMKNRKKIRTSLVGLLSLFLLLSPILAGKAAAQDVKRVEVVAKGTFDQTVDQLKKMVAKEGMMVLSELNQGKILAMTGLKIKAVSLFIGKPTVGKKLFNADPGVGVALPLRVYIFQDGKGKTIVSYMKPSQQLAQFNNKQVDMVAKKLDEKLEMLTKMLAK
jgi:uncharacterized protein (DUF302 family)